jgi:hypothetical protein
MGAYAKPPARHTQFHGRQGHIIPPELSSARLPSGSLGAVVGNYKTLVTRRVKAQLRAVGSDMKVWQRGYWERIIRNERELQATREYIRLNPLRWAEDRDNLDALLSKMEGHNCG